MHFVIYSSSRNPQVQFECFPEGEDSFDGPKNPVHRRRQTGRNRRQCRWLWFHEGRICTPTSFQTSKLLFSLTATPFTEKVTRPRLGGETDGWIRIRIGLLIVWRRTKAQTETFEISKLNSTLMSAH